MVSKDNTERFPHALAWELGKCGLFRMWAYATHEDVDLSLRQVAFALHTDASAEKRAEMEADGIEVREEEGRYFISLQNLRRVYGNKVANRVILYPGQIAQLVGVTGSTASRVVRDMEIAEPRTDITVAPFGAVRHIQRVSPAKFDLPQAVRDKYRPLDKHTEVDPYEIQSEPEPA